MEFSVKPLDQLKEKIQIENLCENYGKLNMRNDLPNMSLIRL